MTCDGLLHKSTSNSPHSSLFEIAEHVSLDKLVIGKPGIKTDADPDDGDDDGGGYMTPDHLANCTHQAHEAGWSVLHLSISEFFPNVFPQMAALCLGSTRTRMQLGYKRFDTKPGLCRLERSIIFILYLSCYEGVTKLMCFMEVID